MNLVNNGGNDQKTVNDKEYLNPKIAAFKDSHVVQDDGYNGKAFPGVYVVAVWQKTHVKKIVITVCHGVSYNFF